MKPLCIYREGKTGVGGFLICLVEAAPLHCYVAPNQLRIKAEREQGCIGSVIQISNMEKYI